MLAADARSCVRTSTTGITTPTARSATISARSRTEPTSTLSRQVCVQPYLLRGRPRRSRLPNVAGAPIILETPSNTAPLAMARVGVEMSPFTCAHAATRQSPRP